MMKTYSEAIAASRGAGEGNADERGHSPPATDVARQSAHSSVICRGNRVIAVQESLRNRVVNTIKKNESVKESRDAEGARSGGAHFRVTTK